MLIDGGVRIADVSRIELFRISSAGETSVEVFSTVFIGNCSCVADALIEEDRRQVSEDFLIGALDDAILLLRIRRGKVPTSRVSSAINSLWKAVPRSVCIAAGVPNRPKCRNKQEAVS